MMLLLKMMVLCLLGLDRWLDWWLDRGLEGCCYWQWWDWCCHLSDNRGGDWRRDERRGKGCSDCCYCSSVVADVVGRR